MIIKTLEGGTIDSNSPVITTHNGYTGEAKEIVFQVENDSGESKTFEVSITGIENRNDYRLAQSEAKLSGAEWSAIDKNQSRNIDLPAGESTTMRARIYIAGGSDTTIIDANINVEEINV